MLPALSEPLLEAVVDKLVESGVEGVDDLVFVEASDLDLLTNPKPKAPACLEIER